jgi:hypothetical protein
MFSLPGIQQNPLVGSRLRELSQARLPGWLIGPSTHSLPQLSRSPTVSTRISGLLRMTRTAMTRMFGLLTATRTPLTRMSGLLTVARSALRRGSLDARRITYAIEPARAIAAVKEPRSGQRRCRFAPRGRLGRGIRFAVNITNPIYPSRSLSFSVFDVSKSISKSSFRNQIEDRLTPSRKPPIERARRFLITKSCGAGQRVGASSRSVANRARNLEVHR